MLTDAPRQSRDEDSAKPRRGLSSLTGAVSQLWKPPRAIPSPYIPTSVSIPTPYLGHVFLPAGTSMNPFKDSGTSQCSGSSGNGLHARKQSLSQPSRPSLSLSTQYMRARLTKLSMNASDHGRGGGTSSLSAPTSAASVSSSTPPCALQKRSRHSRTSVSEGTVMNVAALRRSSVTRCSRRCNWSFRA